MTENTITLTPTYYYIGGENRYRIIRSHKGITSPIWTCYSEEGATKFVADCNFLAHHESETLKFDPPIWVKKKRSK